VSDGRPVGEQQEQRVRTLALMMHISVGRAYYISILLSTAAGTGSWSEARQLACRAAGWDWDELDMSQTDRQAQRIPISTSAAAAAVTACRAHRAGAGAMLPHPHHTVADRHHHPSGLLQPTSSGPPPTLTTHALHIIGFLPFWSVVRVLDWPVIATTVSLQGFRRKDPSKMTYCHRPLFTA